MARPHPGELAPPDVHTWAIGAYRDLVGAASAQLTPLEIARLICEHIAQSKPLHIVIDTEHEVDLTLVYLFEHSGNERYAIVRGGKCRTMLTANMVSRNLRNGRWVHATEVDRWSHNAPAPAPPRAVEYGDGIHAPLPPYPALRETRAGSAAAPAMTIPVAAAPAPEAPITTACPPIASEGAGAAAPDVDAERITSTVSLRLTKLAIEVAEAQLEAVCAERDLRTAGERMDRAASRLEAALHALRDGCINEE